jgi:hypothetical protein
MCVLSGCGFVYLCAWTVKQRYPRAMASSCSRYHTDGTLKLADEERSKHSSTELKIPADLREPPARDTHAAELTAVPGRFPPDSYVSPARANGEGPISHAQASIHPLLLDIPCRTQPLPTCSALPRTSIHQHRCNNDARGPIELHGAASYHRPRARLAHVA